MIEEPSLNCGDGLSCSYRDTISWQGAAAPLPMQNNPQVVFERLFGDGNTAAQRKARRDQSISLLDSVLGEASALQRKLPAADRTRLDQYLTDVREIERRVQKAGQQLSDDLPIPAAPDRCAQGRRRAHQVDVRPAGAGVAGGDHARLHVPDVQGAEHAGLPEERRARRVPHPVAPLQRAATTSDRFAVLNRYHVALLRLFPGQAAVDARRRRHAARSLDGAVRQRDERRQPAQSHRSADPPRGRRVGPAQGRTPLRNPKDTPMANLLLAMLDKLDVTTDKLGDSTGPISL